MAPPTMVSDLNAMLHLAYILIHMALSSGGSSMLNEVGEEEAALWGIRSSASHGNEKNTWMDSRELTKIGRENEAW
jgi:hypothetical protein